jgi:hypothetical protein
MQDMSPPRSQHRSADKRAILRDHYLFGNLTAQQIESLSARIVTRFVCAAVGLVSAAFMPDYTGKDVSIQPPQ